MKLVKNLQVYVLSGALVFVGITSATQAQAAWTSKETSRVKNLESRIQQLERQLASQEVITVRYLATSGAGKTVDDICPGYENLENKPSISATGRLSPDLDLYGNPKTDIYGRSTTAPVYQCKIQVLTKKSN
jgi:hypothetical protein